MTHTGLIVFYRYLHRKKNTLSVSSTFSGFIMPSSVFFPTGIRLNLVLDSIRLANDMNSTSIKFAGFFLVICMDLRMWAWYTMFASTHTYYHLLVLAIARHEKFSFLSFLYLQWSISCFMKTVQNWLINGKRSDKKKKKVNGSFHSWTPLHLDSILESVSDGFSINFSRGSNWFKATKSSQIATFL